MSYTKYREDWFDEPNFTTPVTGAAIEHWEQGIQDAAATADDALELAEAAGGAASTTEAGISEYATSAEAIAGTAADRTVTPVALKAVTDIISPWAHGVYPRVNWLGSAWQSRASMIPTGYVGPVEYMSPFDASATEPTDRTRAGDDSWRDLWTRKVT